MRVLEDKRTFSHAVKGLTGKEEIQLSKFRTFCNLCGTQVPVGAEVIILDCADGETQFYVHVDCAVARLTQLSNHVFRMDVKERPRRKRTRKNSKKVFQGDCSSYCNFCSLLISADEKYVREGPKHYHFTPQGGCYQRYKKTLIRTRVSLSA